MRRMAPSRTCKRLPHLDYSPCAHLSLNSIAQGENKWPHDCASPFLFCCSVTSRSHKNLIHPQHSACLRMVRNLASVTTPSASPRKSCSSARYGNPAASLCCFL